MRKKGFKGRCEKQVLSKSKEVCRTYDAIQSAYANWLEKDDAGLLERESQWDAAYLYPCT